MMALTSDRDQRSWLSTQGAGRPRLTNHNGSGASISYYQGYYPNKQIIIQSGILGRQVVPKAHLQQSEVPSKDKKAIAVNYKSAGHLLRHQAPNQSRQAPRSNEGSSRYKQTISITNQSKAKESQPLSRVSPLMRFDIYGNEQKEQEKLANKLSSEHRSHMPELKKGLQKP